MRRPSTTVRLVFGIVCAAAAAIFLFVAGTRSNSASMLMLVAAALSSGVLGAVMAMRIDMTEQEIQRRVLHDQAERLELTVRSANIGTWDWDVESGRVRFNEALITMLGYSAGEWKGHVDEWESRVHPDDLPQVRRLLSAHIAGATAEYRSEYRLRRKDGSWNWVLDVGRIIERDASGRVRRMTGVHVDIHAARTAADALHEARRQAEAASCAKSAFLANMSHEIRTPMTAILGYADLLAEFGDRERAPHERLEYIETIKRNGEHLLSIINDILDLSKIEAGKMTVEFIAVDPRRLLHEVESLMSVKARAKGIELEIRQETPLPATIQSDPVRLRQILVNLVGNAIKFTELGKVSISASMNIDDPAQPRISFRVDDTGIGMSDAQLETLFSAFHQADSSTTRRFGGTGLGLFISRSLAQILRGSICARSVLGQGSTFTLTLDTGPIKLDSLTRPARLRDLLPTGPAPVAPSESLEGVRVMLAEDGPDNRRLITHYLIKAGATLNVFENGRLALNYLTQSADPEAPLHQPPLCDVILTDMQMPEIDGYALTRALRARGWQGPIIALTAHAMEGDADRCREAGCDTYAAKPINQAQLVTMIRSALRQPLKAL